ncbi:DUF3536 domain-containing protein [Neolewinella antarctica]|uniref:Alpha-amylase/alpha-mannosidase (GH57 family) n=1 Tax=Neolewinella antarctica TaxID=442734 RepID=A0ABX0XA53_9BACT|nr:DUF3536 domain-containing protein [Neolewinella antarctica]NJC25834.1 alpha-amylase/alpha-mannosidase (GH57 family) [Neolewinella antarctica]
MPSNPKKYICIHGHYYQPPRENAWLETIEVQESAAPYHDWNERINEECYAPNATARVLTGDEQISEIRNNYAGISWNMGPTLLSWLEEHDPATYARVIGADEQSQARFGGHGNAIAQSYNHIIMPLANERDKQTQIRWGVADFEHRFGRKPDAMWLSETATDTATLEALVDNGIKFTILAPRQCKSVRHQDNDDWQEVNGGVDSRRAYRCPLPSGRTIDLFFYDGDVSKGVAFEGLLNDGRRLANRLMNSLDANDEVQIAQIATDGESYGHHHAKGEMALAACLTHVEDNPDFELTNYAQFLELHPPVWEAQIHDNSSWSCVHGVERWRSDCGCHTGGGPGWNQSWRAPLRDALDVVRDRLITVFETEGGKLFRDPWAARDAYVELILDRDTDTTNTFLDRHTNRTDLTQIQRVKMLRLLEMQRHAMLMYTSCAWFFNEVTGIETLQVLQYANRALHLCLVITGVDHHPEFVKSLESVPSNVRENAAVSYREAVMPARVGLHRVGMHFAASSLFEEDMHNLELFNYRSEIHSLRRVRAGSYNLALGRMTIRSRITQAQATFTFAVLYLGQQTLIGSLRNDIKAADFEAVAPELEREFRVGHVGEVINLMSANFGSETFSIWNLFKDEKQRILGMMTAQTMRLAARNFSDVYYDNYQLMGSLKANNMPLPDAYKASIRYTLHRRLSEALTGAGPLDQTRLARIVADFQHWDHSWQDSNLDLQKAAEDRLMDRVKAGLDDPEYWTETRQLLDSLELLKLQPNFYRSQNIFLEGWSANYASSLSEPHRRAGLAVARALKLELGQLVTAGMVPEVTG